MSETRLLAESRAEFGKGAARRIRRANKVPAVLYGHGTDPIHVNLPGHETMMALKHGGANALLSIELDGTTKLALPKQVQRHPVKGVLEHVDLLIVEKGEKVTVDVPVQTVGDSAADTLVTIEHPTIALEAEATHIPELIEISVEGLEAGTQLLAKDLRLPQGSSLQVDPETLVVNVTQNVELELETESDVVSEAATEGAAGEQTVAAVATGSPGSAGEESSSE